MRRLPLAIGVVALVFAVARGDGLAGWKSAWHASRGRAALERSTSSGAATADAEDAVSHFGRALDLNPLSRERRLALDRVTEEEIGRLGPERIAELAPPGTLARTVIAAALERHGAGEAASRLRAGVDRTRDEEIEALPSGALRDVALASALGGRCDAALPLLEAAIARGIDELPLDFNYASCLFKVGEPKRALPALTAACVRNPASRWSSAFLAETHRRLGNLEEAEKNTRWLTSRAADFYYGWRVRGDVLAGMGRWREAADSYRRAFALEPDKKWLKWSIRRMEEKIAEQASAGHVTAAPAAGCAEPATGACS